jgi:hypothetical protein
VEFVSVQHRTHLLKAGAEGFEDGTPNFGAIAALDAGLELLGDAGMANVKRHVGGLTAVLLAELAALRHGNGRKMTRVYGPTDNRARGGTVAFNVVDRFGRVVPYQRVEQTALRRGVSIRGGCFCNPGAAERAFGFPASASAACMERARGRAFLSRRSPSAWVARSRWGGARVARHREQRARHPEAARGRRSQRLTGRNLPFRAPIRSEQLGFAERQTQNAQTRCAATQTAQKVPCGVPPSAHPRRSVFLGKGLLSFLASGPAALRSE